MVRCVQTFGQVARLRTQFHLFFPIRGKKGHRSSMPDSRTYLFGGDESRKTGVSNFNVDAAVWSQKQVNCFYLFFFFTLYGHKSASSQSLSSPPVCSLKSRQMAPQGSLCQHRSSQGAVTGFNEGGKPADSMIRTKSWMNPGVEFIRDLGLSLFSRSAC